jgi:hypothetical protein
VSLSALDLEPIKTALAAGDYPSARRLRVQLLLRVIDAMGDHWQEPHVPLRYPQLLNMLDALGIPEE